MTSGKPRILAVDDEPANLLLLGAVLGDEYDLFLARSGEEALARAVADPPPELILLDVVMPGVDGYGVLVELKRSERTADIPVIFLTARSSVADEERGFELGAVDYVNKPFRASIVRARIRTHLELKRKTDQLNALSRQDSLTGLLNKRGLQDVLVRSWAHAVREGADFAVALFDIDYFKHYNDAYGHLAGDDCLAAVAGALKGSLRRAGDAAVRFGGEEFLLVLPDTDAAGAMAVAESARCAVAGLALAAAPDGVAPYVTVSAGVAACRPAPGSASAELLAAADAALYAAKNAGRDRVRQACPG
jgi:diguanylate cyclase (GGDEF)-like protein